MHMPHIICSAITSTLRIDNAITARTQSQAAAISFARAIWSWSWFRIVIGRVHDHLIPIYLYTCNLISPIYSYILSLRKLKLNSNQKMLKQKIRKILMCLMYVNSDFWQPAASCSNSIRFVQWMMSITICVTKMQCSPNQRRWRCRMRWVDSGFHAWWAWAAFVTSCVESIFSVCVFCVVMQSLPAHYQYQHYQVVCALLFL